MRGSESLGCSRPWDLPWSGTRLAHARAAASSPHRPRNPAVPLPHIRPSMPLLTGVTTVGLVAAVLVGTPPTATASSGTFTQPAPVTASFESHHHVWNATEADVMPDADGET